MANIIDSLLITLGLDSSGVGKGMDSAEKRLAGGVKNITNNILAPLAGAFAFGALINNFINTADALGKLSKTLRADVQDIKAWGDAVEYAGGDANALNSTLTGLNDKLKASRFGNVFELRALGINSKNANGSLKTSVDILKELSQVSEKVNPRRFELLTKKLGIDVGTIRLLQSGSKEVDRLVSKYKDLAYTQKDAETARKFNQTMGDLNKTFQAGAAIFMRYFIPALSEVGQKAEYLVNFLRKHEKFVLLFFTLLAAVIAYKLSPAIWAMTKAWLANPMAKVIALVLLLAIAFEDLWAFVEGGGSAIEDLMKKFGASKETIESTRAGAKEFLDVMTQYGPALIIVTAGIKGVTLAMHLMGVASLSNPVLAIIFAIAMAATYLITNWNGISAWWVDLWAGLKKTAAEWIDGIYSILPNWLKKMLGIGGEKLKISTEIQASINDADQKTKDFGSVAKNGDPYEWGAAKSRSDYTGSMYHSTENNTKMGNITFNIKSTDPAEAARESSNEIRRMVASGNKGVRQ